MAGFGTDAFVTNLVEPSEGRDARDGCYPSLRPRRVIDSPQRPNVVGIDTKMEEVNYRFKSSGTGGMSMDDTGISSDSDNTYCTSLPVPGAPASTGISFPLSSRAGTISIVASMVTIVAIYTFSA